MDINALLRHASEAIERSRYAEAMGDCETILKRRPKSVEAMGLLGTACLGAQRYADAKKWTRKVLTARSADEMASFNMALIYLHEGNVEGALRTIVKARNAHPDSVKLNGLHAQICNTAGQREEAAAIAGSFIERGVLDPLIAREFATAAQRVGKEAEAVRYIRRCLDSDGVGGAFKPGLWLVLGRLLDRMNQTDEAFDAFARGHAALRTGFDINAFEARVERVITNWTADSIASRRDWGDPSDVPVLILGMPRSGTTLAEHILASHPDVTACGELGDLSAAATRFGGQTAGAQPLLEDPSVLEAGAVSSAARDYVHRLRKGSAQALRATDKMPLNFLALGLASIMTPHARVVHCVRDPRDVCLSCYMQHLSAMPFTHDLADLGRMYLAHNRLMDHWRRVCALPIFELRYEEMVADQEATTRALVDFVGLDWDDRCLAFYTVDRAAVTASYEQVRNPIYKSAVDRWRRYEKHLGPLLDVLGREERAGAV